MKATQVTITLKYQIRAPENEDDPEVVDIAAVHQFNKHLVAIGQILKGTINPTHEYTLGPRTKVQGES